MNDAAKLTQNRKDAKKTLQSKTKKLATNGVRVAYNFYQSDSLLDQKRN